jgi:hypothetical protein
LIFDKRRKYMNKQPIKNYGIAILEEDQNVALESAEASLPGLRNRPLVRDPSAV